MSAAKRAMDARRRNTMETVMALEIKGDTASVDDGGGTLTLLDQGPYGPQHGVIAISAVRIQGELRRGRAHDIESSEVLRLAMFLLETQSREHVPLHPIQRSLLEAAIAVLRVATAPQGLEFLDSAYRALGAARAEWAQMRKRGERAH
jgi:hypothetical protein